MIRSVHVNQEVKILDEKAKKGIGSLSDVLKGIGLIIKVLSDIKFNQVIIMKNKGIKLQTNYKKRPEKKD